MSYLRSIARLSNTDNLGGVLTISIARTADVVSIPAPIDGVYYEAPVFLAGRGFINWMATSQSAGYSARSRESQEGPYKNGTLPFTIPKGNAGVLQMLKKAELDEFIIMFRDGNGKLTLWGNKEAPVNFKFDYATGRQTRNLNAFDCEFYTEAVDNLFFYEADFGTVPGNGVVPALVKNYAGAVVAVLYPGEILQINSPYLFEAYIL